jgi:hypothetical protein
MLSNAPTRRSSQVRPSVQTPFLHRDARVRHLKIPVPFELCVIVVLYAAFTRLRKCSPRFSLTLPSAMASIVAIVMLTLIFIFARPRM